MKPLIPILFVMMAVGCGKTKQPVKELTIEEKVVGTYEGKRAGNTFKYFLLDNGVFEYALNIAERGV